MTPRGQFSMARDNVRNVLLIQLSYGKMID
jgi:hypothetical protein